MAIYRETKNSRTGENRSCVLLSGFHTVSCVVLRAAGADRGALSLLKAVSLSVLHVESAGNGM